MDEGELEDAFEGFEDRHLAGAAGTFVVGGDAGLFRLGDGGGGLFSVRLGGVSRCSEMGSLGGCFADGKDKGWQEVEGVPS